MRFGVRVHGAWGKIRFRDVGWGLGFGEKGL